MGSGNKQTKELCPSSILTLRAGLACCLRGTLGPGLQNFRDGDKSVRRRTRTVRGRSPRRRQAKAASLSWIQDRLYATHQAWGPVTAVQLAGGPQTHQSKLDGVDLENIDPKYLDDEQRQKLANYALDALGRQGKGEKCKGKGKGKGKEKAQPKGKSAFPPSVHGKVACVICSMLGNWLQKCLRKCSKGKGNCVNELGAEIAEKIAAAFAQGS